MCLKRLLVKWAMDRSMMRVGSEKVQVEASYGRWESLLSRRGTEAGMSGGSLRQGQGEEDLGCGDSWRRLPAALHVWAWILSELCLAPSLPLCLPSTSHCLFSAPQMWSSEVNICKEKGGGERISRVLLTDGLRGNILALRKRMKNLSLLTIPLAKNFMRFFP